MKVICIDNYARDYISDSLVCENINHYYGTRMVDWLNEKYSDKYSPDYYKLVDDEYVLYKHEI